MEIIGKRYKSKPNGTYRNAFCSKITFSATSTHGIRRKIWIGWNGIKTIAGNTIAVTVEGETYTQTYTRK